MPSAMSIGLPRERPIFSSRASVLFVAAPIASGDRSSPRQIRSWPSRSSPSAMFARAAVGTPNSSQPIRYRNMNTAMSTTAFNRRAGYFFSFTPGMKKDIRTSSTRALHRLATAWCCGSRSPISMPPSRGRENYRPRSLKSRTSIRGRAIARSGFAIRTDMWS